MKMQLLYSPTSPYARKLRVLMAELDLGHRIELVTMVPLEDPAALTAANPLTKVPVLVTGLGPTDTIFDSPVIAAYLLSLAPRQTLLPMTGPQHWQALTIEALADGILDAALTLRFDAAAGGTDRSPYWTERLRRAIDGAVAGLPARLAATGDGFDYATACVVIALEYLDFRFADIDWRRAAPALATLHRRWAERPSLATTRPA
jgi:glutathione S-transferase